MLVRNSIRIRMEDPRGISSSERLNYYGKEGGDAIAARRPFTGQILDAIAAHLLGPCFIRACRLMPRRDTDR